MACTDDVLIIQNPLWKEEAEQSEAAYGVDLDREVGVFDMVRHPMGSSSSAPRDQQSPPLRRPLAALGNSQRVAAVAGVRKQKRVRLDRTQLVVQPKLGNTTNYSYLSSLQIARAYCSVHFHRIQIRAWPFT